MRRTLAQRAREAGISYRTARDRRHRGWSEHELVMAPRQQGTYSTGNAPDKAHPWKRAPSCNTARAVQLNQAFHDRAAKADQ